MAFIDALARRQLSPAGLDTALAVVFAAGGLAAREDAPAEYVKEPGLAGILLILLSTLPLAAHHRRPLPVLLTIAAAVLALREMDYVRPLVGPWGGPSVGFVHLALAAGVFLTALRSGARTAAWAGFALIPAVAVAEALFMPAYRLPTAVTVTVLLTGAWALGRLFMARRLAARETLLRAAAVEREQAANARAALARERTRIARELHDIVAHNVSLMVVQTIAAGRVRERDPGTTRDLLRTVEETGRATVTELRRLLEVLRTDDEADRDPTREPPQPSTEAIPALVEAVRAAGLRVDFSRTGTPAPLPAGSELTAYRVVQEALTNTLKHAGRARCRLAVDWQEAPRLLRLRVCDDGGRPGGGPPLAAPAAQGAGHGLTGMAERIAAVEGTLHTGPRPGRGFCVHATIPVPGPEPGTPPGTPAGPASAIAPGGSP
ncbi:histidine kinase [Streptomyces sp. WAC 00631]|uniref:sensor histidine kinase n=1 Tax=Streptomyces sp. WAC 00631 TaxID=2203201 RepID=UPI00163C1BFF|nr:histidine kinase [Streptomyces sp. WAC 00631]MCC5033516.1 histidine kinase [Streptomyces sp. WAC 00631]